MKEMKMWNVEMKDVLKRADEIVDQYELTEKEERNLRLLAEETLSFAKQLFGDREAYFVIRKEPDDFAFCYRTKSTLSVEEKKKMIDFSTNKKNAKTRTLSGKAKEFMNYLFSASVDLNSGIGIYGGGNLGGYDVSWSMKEFKKVRNNMDGDELEKAIIAKLADDIIVGILGNDVELTVKMKLGKA